MPNNINRNRKTVAITLDYSLRMPDIKEQYDHLKSRIFSNDQVGEGEEDDPRGFFETLQTTDKEALSFYEQTYSPKSNWGEDFDYTWEKYFYNKEHLLKFMQEYSFSLFGKSDFINFRKGDSWLINTAQSKLCDVFLIDTIPVPKKVGNTFYFLSRTGIFTKGVEFYADAEDIKKNADYDFIYDSINFKNNIINPNSQETKINGLPTTKKLYNFFIKLEKEISNNE